MTRDEPLEIDLVTAREQDRRPGEQRKDLGRPPPDHRTLGVGPLRTVRQVLAEKAALPAGQE